MATIKDIAEAVGVSIGTVDRILHNRGRYSAETAERVKAAMAELNYTPNIHARGLKKSGSRRFLAVIPERHQDAGYWRLVSVGIERAAEELRTFSIEIEIISFDRYSGQSVKELLHRLPELRPDGLLIAPVMPEIFRAGLDKLSIPYIFIDTDIPDDNRRLSFIGQDSFQSGVLSAKLMKMLIDPEAGNILIIDPPGDNFHLQSRISGFRKYMEDNCCEPELRVIKIEDDDEQLFHRSLDQLTAAADRFDGIFAANSSVYYAASWLERKGGDYRKIPVIGYDLIPGREALIENGVIDFILTQQPEEQAYRGIMTLYDVIVLNRRADSNVLIPLNIITKENLHTFG